jgi:pimeloyl-ACP methyl ester carboxylesterase
VHVQVNGVRLFVEVFGQKLLPDGPRMRERPTVVGLHGGPSDHAHLRELIAPLADVAQVILYDHRGCGRSEHAIRRCGRWRSGATTFGVCATRSESSGQS